MTRLCLLLFALLIAATAAVADEIRLSVTYLRQEVRRPPTLSNLDPVPADLGEMGVRLGLAENRTTGRFLGHGYELEVMTVPEGGDFAAAAERALLRTPFLILDAPAPQLLDAADLDAARGALLFNIARAEDALRDTDCRANLFHTLPSFLMRSDALMQFAVHRRWSGLALVSGTRPDDLAFAEALRRSARKFGLTLAAQKSWAFDADMRRDASAEVPLFSQELGSHDLLLVADEAGDFGRYIAYNTWLARPVAGSEGLVPAGWAPVVEQWGAAQLQARFRDLAGRGMHPEDYAGWAAIRTLGEAVTRTGSADAATLRRFILSDAFELAGFKGRPLSYRAWNGQLRQPIPLVTARSLVAQAPLPGFLHERSELDTLGLDAPESGCGAFR